MVTLVGVEAGIVAVADPRSERATPLDEHMVPAACADDWESGL